MNGLGKGVVGLIALAIFINYVDRGNLATAAPLIKDQLHLNNAQIGLLLSAFFWVYTPGQLVAGWLAERINPYRTLAIGLAVWALATAATSLAGGFLSLLVLRLFLGLGEAAAFPASSKLLAASVPRAKLGAANGLIMAGLALGPAFGTLAGGLMMAKIGWRPVFLVFGLASLLWLIPWLIKTRHASKSADGAVRSYGPSYISLLGRRAVWGASLGHFSGNYILYFIVSWLPLFLVKSRGFSVSQMAELGACVYLLQAASAWLTGWLSDRWMRAGASDNLVRKSFLVAGSLGSAGALVACISGGQVQVIASLLAAGFFFGFISPSIYATGQTLAGPGAAGKWIGLQNCIGNLAGIVAPIVTGVVVDRSGTFVSAFVITAVIAVIGAACWGLVIRRVEPEQWGPAPGPALAAAAS